MTTHKCPSCTVEIEIPGSVTAALARAKMANVAAVPSLVLMCGRCLEPAKIKTTGANVTGLGMVSPGELLSLLDVASFVQLKASRAHVQRARADAKARDDDEAPARNGVKADDGATED